MSRKPLAESYENALRRIEQLMNAEPNTPEFEELKNLSILVEAYENEKFAGDLS